ncbi:enoyl-CoA hydratase/isomerase family protein [Ornithinimicrobium faecis]|uniref:enoyl-CoA hydratase/isomerase family protein n=1 Tax=Ornithinimicrobium faecis TaxID=2934158 RepID=UPI00211835F0|nr:enoyl-CoA hydratase-related protein [Ornithinimicrobium sp. HY1745]
MSQTDTTTPVLIERDGGVAVVRLNRPEAMNSLNTATKEALLAALREVAEDESVRAVVLTGTGRAFCVGQDINDLQAPTDADASAEGNAALSGTVRAHYNPTVQLLATMDKPVIAAVNGIAAGAGASFAFAADLRIVAASAGFNTAFTGIALSCDSGASYHLPRLIGAAKAKELLLLPRTVKADEALELGLATQVVADEDFEAHVRELAQTLAAGPTKAYGAVRRAVAFSATHELAESLEHEAELMASTGASADHKTAVAAFLAKEKPVFEGR